VGASNLPELVTENVDLFSLDMDYMTLHRLLAEYVDQLYMMANMCSPKWSPRKNFWQNSQTSEHHSNHKFIFNGFLLALKMKILMECRTNICLFYCNLIWKMQLFTIQKLNSPWFRSIMVSILCYCQFIKTIMERN
jgi:hypothetical protein